MRALWEVSRKRSIIKSNQVQKIATAQKNQKKENAQDIISKSLELLCVKKSGTIGKIYDVKFGFIIGYTMGSKSNNHFMKPSRIHKKEAAQNRKLSGGREAQQKKENALDIISKSLKKKYCRNGSGRLSNLKFF